jgi:hypothetical protein
MFLIYFLATSLLPCFTSASILSLFFKPFPFSYLYIGFPSSFSFPESLSPSFFPSYPTSSTHSSNTPDPQPDPQPPHPNSHSHCLRSQTRAIPNLLLSLYRMAPLPTLPVRLRHPLLSRYHHRSRRHDTRDYCPAQRHGAWRAWFRKGCIL